MQSATTSLILLTKKVTVSELSSKATCEKWERLTGRAPTKRDADKTSLLLDFRGPTNPVTQDWHPSKPSALAKPIHLVTLGSPHEIQTIVSPFHR